MTKKSDFFTPYYHMCEAIAQLFHPLVEVAIHDLTTGKITAVYNNISRKSVGAKYPLDAPMEELGLLEPFPDIFPPYMKRNWTGRPLKCVAVTLRDFKRKPLGLITISADIGAFEEIYRLVSVFIAPKKEVEKPSDLFGPNPQESLIHLVDMYARSKGSSRLALTKDEKRELVIDLHRKGAFFYKSAPQILARELGLSRATIYNYIKSIE